MVEKCANRDCSETFDYRQGRLYCRPVQLPDGSPLVNSHGVEHYWLCGSCSKSHTFEHRAGFGVVVTPRPKPSIGSQLCSEIRVSGGA